MYEGSMVGAGSHVFAVWNYAIAKQEPDRSVGSQVRLNPFLLAAIIGDTEKRMQEAIDYLCRPDRNTTTEVKDGRRLVKIGTFDYQVVNGAKYRKIRNQEERREQNRQAQARYRARNVSRPLTGEVSAMKAAERGDERGFEQIAEERG
jgi:hypothetical protein